MLMQNLGGTNKEYYGIFQSGLLGIDWTNPWIAQHFVRSITDLFKEILIFNYHKTVKIWLAKRG